MCEEDTIQMKKTLYACLAILAIAIIFIAFTRLGGLDSDRVEAQAMYGGPASQFVVINGERLHYRDEGRGEPLVLLHGSRASLHQWDGWVSELKNQFRIIRLDARAHGLSEAGVSDDFTPERGVELLQDFLDELGIQKFNLGGTSAGSILAVRFAAKHPERVKKMVLSTVPLKLPATAQTPLLNSVVFWLHQRLMQSLGTDLFWKTFLEGIFADPYKVTDDMIERYRILNSFPGRSEEFRRLINEWYRLGGPGRDFETAANVTAPLLLQWGAAGPVLPLELQCEVAGAFASASVRVITYTDLGHKLVMEDPIRTARDAAAFLAGDIVGTTCSEPVSHENAERNIR